jgi:hypothetical protein
MKRQDRPVHELPSLARYLNKVFDFRANAETLTDSRIGQEIPPSAVFLAAFHGFAFRLPSFQQLEAELTQPALQQWIGAGRAFRDDVLRYSLSGFHLEGLEQMLVQVNRTLKRNKALDTGRVQGRIVAALDGIEVLSSLQPLLRLLPPAPRLGAQGRCENRAGAVPTGLKGSRASPALWAWTRCCGNIRESCGAVRATRPGRR